MKRLIYLIVFLTIISCNDVSSSQGIVTGIYNYKKACAATVRFKAKGTDDYHYQDFKVACNYFIVGDTVLIYPITK